ncbi:MAG: hypothetical protein ABIC04_02870 [Nanoarchaeota archaeon]
MNPFLIDAMQEIKRVDHLVYVSLKYTRTVDVIKSVIDRVINAFDCIINALLGNLEEKKIISDIPTSPGLKIGLLQKHLKDEIELQKYLELYLTLRKIARCDYTKREEYRRHVTMIAALDDGNIIDVDIDLSNEYYETTKSFLTYARDFIYGKKNE